MALIETKILPRNNPTGRGKPPKLLIFQCDVCSTVFERPKKKFGGFLKKTRHYCGSRCFYDDPVVRAKKMTGMSRPCPHCGTFIYCSKRELGLKWGKFCRKECYHEYRSEHPELYQENIHALHSSNAVAKANITRKKRMKLGDFVHPMKGRKHSAETRKKIGVANRGKMAGDRNPMKRGHSEKSKQKMSDTRTRLMIEGKIKSYGKKDHKRGDYTSLKTGNVCFYRSSWELAMMEFLDRNEEVATWEYESVRIPYYYENYKRWYVPDFIVTYSDGSKKMLEIKPRDFLDDEKTRLKADVGREFCIMNEISKYCLLPRSALVEMGVLRY